MPDIRHELIIGAPANEVYNAITIQEGLAAWWTPGATATPELNSIARFPFGTTYFKEMKITDLVPSRLVTWVCIAGTGEWVGTTITFQLIPGDKKSFLELHPEIGGQVEQQSGNHGTLVVFSHDNWKDYTAMFAECNYTWGRFLWSLKMHCEQGDGRPWPNQHHV